MTMTKWRSSELVGIGACAAVVVVAGIRSGLIPMAWWGPAPLSVMAAILTGLISAAQMAPIRTHVYRSVAWVVGGVWVSWACGWPVTVWTVAAALADVALLVGLRSVTRPATVMAQAGVGLPSPSPRPPITVWYEQALCYAVGNPVAVLDVEPWPDPQAGERVYIDLRPARGKVKESDIREACQAIAIALNLDHGCVPEVIRGGGQGQVAIDVPLRAPAPIDTAAIETYAAASVYDEFTVMHTPRGEALNICLRERSAIIGAAPGWGKTTLLNRIIKAFQRCTDTVTCIVDTNGGGLAIPWMRPYALGLVNKPPIGWVAANEAEALALTCVLKAITKDRKHSPEAIARRHGANDAVLRVDARVPLYAVVQDEGGDLRQARSLVGQIASANLSNLAQIGRAEGSRVIGSVLRGTSDLLDKGLRVMCAIRICLRMEEEDEYGHVLGKNPPKIELMHKGEGFIRTPEIPNPVFGRTVNVLLDEIERCVVATNGYRCDFDERAHQVAARLRPIHLMGREIDEDTLALPGMREVVRDMEAGEVLTNRWARYERYLAAMRGEDVPEEDEIEAASTAKALTSGNLGGAVGQLVAAVGQPKTAEPPIAVAATEPPRRSARDEILDVLCEGPLTSGEIGQRLDARRRGCARTYRLKILRDLREEGLVWQQADNMPYSLVEAKTP